MAGPAWGGPARPSRPGAEADCAFPPHPGEDDRGALPVPVQPEYGYGLDGERGAFRSWVAVAPLERAPLPFIPLVWLAGVMAWAVGMTPRWSLPAAGAAVAVAWVWAWWKARRDPEVAVHPSTAAFLAAVAGLWAGLACARYGPLAGWYGSVSWGWALAGVAGWQLLARGPAAREVRAREAKAAAWQGRKAQWHAEIAPLLGMTGWFLMVADKTLIGERWVAAAGPGYRASDVLARRRKVIEDLTQYLGLNWGDVDLNLTGVPGEIEFWIRTGDPWAEPVWHPVVKPGGEFDEMFPGWPDTITVPRKVGVDPETGDPMQVVLWDDHGAKVVAIEAAKDGGKTTLIDNLNAGILVCDDAVLLQVNLSKALEAGWWADLTEASALGPGEHERASAILDFLLGVVELRPEGGRMTKVHRPSPGEPLFIAEFDELDKTLKTAEDRQRFEVLCSILRSEGVAVVYAVQRGDRSSVGSAAIQAHTDIVIWGKFARARELTHVAGREAGLPDMGEYGGGAAGVFGIASLPYRGDLQRGRTFYWGEHQRAQRRVVADLSRKREPLRELEPALAQLQELWDEICGRKPLAAVPSPSAGIREKIEAGRRRLAGLPETDILPKQDKPDESGNTSEKGKKPDKADVPGGTGASGVTVPGVPARALTALLDLAAQPGGVSSKQAAAALAAVLDAVPSDRTILRWLAATATAGLTEVRGDGSARRFHRTAGGAASPAPDEPAAEPGEPAGDESGDGPE